MSARVIEVEVICSDPDEHRRRAEERVVDVPSLVQPTWEQILRREYETWQRERLVVDTAVLAADQAVRTIRTVVDE